MVDAASSSCVGGPRAVAPSRSTMAPRARLSPWRSNGSRSDRRPCSTSASAMAGVSALCCPENADPGRQLRWSAGEQARQLVRVRIRSLRVTAVSSCPKSPQPFNEPERCHEADPIGRKGPQPTFDDVGDSKLLGQLNDADNCGDEGKLSHLDADVEGE